jgi:hypothetical protein
MMRICLFMLLAMPLMAAEGKIYKVLPTFIDKEGRHSLSPSLYERDAYQGHMRKHPDLRKGLRFDVHWKAHGSSVLKLHMDIRGTKDNEPTNLSAEAPVKPPRFFGKWSAVVVSGDDFKRMGELRSWRATIMDGDQVIAEQKSFLW